MKWIQESRTASIYSDSSAKTQAIHSLASNIQNSRNVYVMGFKADHDHDDDDDNGQIQVNWLRLPMRGAVATGSFKSKSRSRLAEIFTKKQVWVVSLTIICLLTWDNDNQQAGHSKDLLISELRFLINRLLPLCQLLTSQMVMNELCNFQWAGCESKQTKRLNL